MASSSSAAGASSSSAPAPAGSGKMVALRAEDGEEFEIEEAVAMQSQTIRNMIEDGCADSTIPVPNICGRVLAKVLDFCKMHAAPPDDIDPKDFNADFMEGMGYTELFELLLAANYLNIQGLLDLGCQTVADRIKDKTPEEVRDIFGVENDYTPEEEKEVRKQNAWAFDQQPDQQPLNVLQFLKKHSFYTHRLIL